MHKYIENIILQYIYFHVKKSSVYEYCFDLLIENPDDYSYPTTGHHYGQSFLCISVKVEEVDKIGLQLIYNEPHIYTFKISDNLR